MGTLHQPPGTDTSRRASIAKVFATLALALHIVVLYSCAASMSASGDERLGSAIVTFLICGIQWITIASGTLFAIRQPWVPTWVGRATLIMLPLAFVAAIAALDLCSKRPVWPWCLAFLIPCLAVAHNLCVASPRNHNSQTLEFVAARLRLAMVILCAAAIVLAILC